MSGDIFANPARVPLANRTHFGFGPGSPDGVDEGSVTWVPRGPEMQEIVDAINAEEDAERVRKEIEMDTPENRQKAFEADVAERERKKINFHFARAMPSSLNEGWKHLREELADEEIRVYTTNYRQRRFWGIKPVGMGMYDFWEQNDPEVKRYDDNVAITWANPLLPPPLTASDRIYPVIWAGQGLNPDLVLPELPMVEDPPSKKVTTKPRKRQKTPKVDSTHRVRKSTPESSKIDMTSRNSLAHKVDAGILRLEDHVREVPMAAHAMDRSTRNKRNIIASNAQQKPATEDHGSVPSKRPRGRPAAQTKLAANDTKRPRGRPPGKGKLAERLPAAQTKSAANDTKRPRGRPPGKKQAERLPKQKKIPTVKGNARITKSSQTQQRAAPSTHKMRTRGKGLVEFLQLP